MWLLQHGNLSLQPAAAAAENMHKLAAVLLAIAALCSGRGALGQRAEAPFVLREDLPHIGCRVCEIVVQRLRDNVEAARAAAPYNKVRGEPPHTQCGARDAADALMRCGASRVRRSLSSWF